MADPQGKPSGMGMLYFLVPMILVMYFFMIRPQAKKAKDQKKFVNDLQKGDKIVTIAGIHGKVYKLNDDNTVDMEISPGSYLKIERSAISMEWSKAQASASDKK
ncbi:MAG: preprotein translocase subunit YajC [Bacteroidetes bacterium]|nr:preprotein translocase subunit YajC [Bacteroidota bacterium]